MKFLLDRAMAPHIIRFFDICFKQGVLDAYEYGDDMEAKSFLRARKEDWKFCTLTRENDQDWQTFRFTLYWWARRNHMSKLAEGFIFNLRTKTPAWCFLIYCMRFYLMGVSEWLEYPNPLPLEIFKHHGKIHWDPNERVKKITKPDFISYMYDFALDYRAIPEAERPMSVITMDGFVKALFDLTR